MTSGDPTRNLRLRPVSGRRHPPGSNRAANQGRLRAAKGGYSVDTPANFRLDRFAAADNLQVAFKQLEQFGGAGAGVDDLTFDDFSRGELKGALRRVSASLRSQAYRPYETLPVFTPKGDGRYRELRLHRLTDRTVAKALQLCLDTYWRSQLPGIGRSTWQLFAELQRLIRERRTYVLAIDDLENCFPSINIADVLEAHQHITQPDLLWLIATVIRGHKGPGHTTGLDQGSPYSPVATELLLHTRLDVPLGARCPGYPLLLRYVDNLTVICSSEREGHEALRIIREIINPSGLKLKAKDGNPQDLRDQNFDKTVLGLIPRWRNGLLEFTIPESGHRNLKEGLIKAMEHPHPTRTARMVLKGWVMAMGPVLTNKATPEVLSCVLQTARECGFREFSLGELRKTARLAYDQWIRLVLKEG